MKPRSAEEIVDFSLHATLLPVLEAAIRTRVLEAIREPATLADVLTATGLKNEAAVERLLRVLCAAGLARVENDGRLAATDTTIACLLPTSPVDLGSYVVAMTEISRALLDGYAAQLSEVEPSPRLPSWDNSAGGPTAQLQSLAMAAAIDDAVLHEVTTCAITAATAWAARRRGGWILGAWILSAWGRVQRAPRDQTGGSPRVFEVARFHGPHPAPCRKVRG